MIAAIALLFTTLVQINPATRMKPELLHLTIGMSREEAMAAIGSYGPKVKGDEATFDYTDRTWKICDVTLQFQHERLRAIRYEESVSCGTSNAMNALHFAFDEANGIFHEWFGQATKETPTLVMFDRPRMMAILSIDQIHQKAAIVVVYYDPAGEP